MNVVRSKALRAGPYAMLKCFYSCLFLLSCFLMAGRCLADTSMADDNVIINGGFEQGLTGWTTEGDVTIETATPQTGTKSVRIGQGKGAVRQKYAVGGLRIINLGANLKTSAPEVEGFVRAQCYDDHNHLVMNLEQPLDARKVDGKEHYAGIYFKTHAHTKTLVLSLEKTTEAGVLYADSVVLADDDRDRKDHPTTADLDQYMQPFWTSKTVYSETVLLFSEAGKPASGKLMFTPEKILAVRDYSLTKTYEPGKDYTVEGKTLTVTASSSMPTLKDSELPKDAYPWLNLLGKHVVVTYTHSDAWTGMVPEYQGDRLPRTLKKLTERSPLTIVATGDSITLGTGTSATTQIPPYMPTWGDLFVRRLGQIYGDRKIQFYNTALGGMTSDWGLANIEGAVASLEPDLVIIAFGMNDFWSLSGEDFKKNIQGIMERVRKKRPDAEFVLVASMRFDPAYATEAVYPQHIKDYEQAILSLKGPGVSVLDMTALTGALFDAKKPKDFLADPLHPNDFLARWYAQGLVALFVPMRRMIRVVKTHRSMAFRRTSCGRITLSVHRTSGGEAVI